jgi:hypothetical protein
MTKRKSKYKPTSIPYFDSMVKSDGCVHNNEIYIEDQRMYLICKKCDKSWPV